MKNAILYQKKAYQKNKNLQDYVSYQLSMGILSISIYIYFYKNIKRCRYYFLNW